MSKSTSPSATHRYFFYSPEGDGHIYFDSIDERDAAVHDEILQYLDDQWSEDVEGVIVGEVTGIATRVNIKHKPIRKDFDSDEDFEDTLVDFLIGANEDCDYTCDYKIMPLPESQKP